MSSLTHLHAHFGNRSYLIKYTRSVSASAYHYLVLVSDADLFSRHGIRLATFTYQKVDFRFEHPVIRYGNTDPGVRLPDLVFEEAITHAIRLQEGVGKNTGMRSQEDRQEQDHPVTTSSIH